MCHSVNYYLAEISFSFPARVQHDFASRTTDTGNIIIGVPFIFPPKENAAVALGNGQRYYSAFDVTRPDGFGNKFAAVKFIRYGILDQSVHRVDNHNLFAYRHRYGYKLAGLVLPADKIVA